MCLQFKIRVRSITAGVLSFLILGILQQLQLKCGNLIVFNSDEPNLQFTQSQIYNQLISEFNIASQQKNGSEALYQDLYINPVITTQDLDSLPKNISFPVAVGDNELCFNVPLRYVFSDSIFQINQWIYVPAQQILSAVVNNIQKFAYFHTAYDNFAPKPVAENQPQTGIIAPHITACILESLTLFYQTPNFSIIQPQKNTIYPHKKSLTSLAQNIPLDTPNVQLTVTTEMLCTRVNYILVSCYSLVQSKDFNGADATDATKAEYFYNIHKTLHLDYINIKVDQKEFLNLTDTQAVVMYMKNGSQSNILQKGKNAQFYRQVIFLPINLPGGMTHQIDIRARIKKVADQRPAISQAPVNITYNLACTVFYDSKIYHDLQTREFYENPFIQEQQ